MMGLVVVGILAFYPGASSDTKLASSNIYWTSGYATPFQITEAASLSEDACGNGVLGNYVLVLKNVDRDVLVLKGVKTDGSARTFCQIFGPGDYDLSSPIFDPGQLRKIRVQKGALYCSPGQLVEMDVTFTYDTPQIPNKIQKGSVKVAFPCTLSITDPGGGG